MQYWPPSKEKVEIYGELSVRILREEELANFHIRTFEVATKTEKVGIIVVYFSMTLKDP